MSANPKVVRGTASEFNLVIDGRSTPGAATLDVINPATGRLLRTCARADEAQLNAAVAASKAAFPAWAATPIEKRREALMKIAAALAERSAEFARLLTQEQGKPLAHATGEIAGSVGLINAFAAMDLPIKVLRDNESERIMQLHAPLGVVAAITPWNFPMLLLMMKVAPALLAGNTDGMDAATVWGADTKRASDVAQRVASGTVWVNKHLDLPPDVPFGGAKQSGLGAELRQEGLEEFTQSRIINIAK